MSPSHPPMNPGTMRTGRPRAGRVGPEGSPVGVVWMLGLGLVVMVPWPASVGVLMWSMLDRTSEAMFFFGGITSLFVWPLSLVFGGSEHVFAIAIALVWLLVWLGPAPLLRRRIRGRRGALGVLLLQAGFSLGQAAVGALMILGKSV